MLAVSMCPSFAFASQLEAGSGGDLSAQALSTQAAKKTVYVITSVTTNSKYPMYSTGHDYGSPKEMTKYSYNKNGLITKHADKGKNNTGSTTYTYKGNNIVGMNQKVNTMTTKVAYTPNKKGQATNAKYMSKTSAKGGYASTASGTVTATYKSDNLVKREDAYTIKSSYGGPYENTTTYTYTYKDGRLRSRRSNGQSSTATTTSRSASRQCTDCGLAR